MAGLVFIGTSMDGYIARVDGSIDWLVEYPNPEKSDFGYSDFMSRVQAIVMGRKTFETVLGFESWPYAHPVFVLSSSLDPDKIDRFRGKFDIVTGTPGDIVRNLSARGFERLYIDGGYTIRTFLKASLIDEITISTIPVILGNGIPLFSPGLPEQNFYLNDTRKYNNGIVQNTWRRENNPAQALKPDV